MAKNLTKILLILIDLNGLPFHHTSLHERPLICLIKFDVEMKWPKIRLTFDILLAGYLTFGKSTYNPSSLLASYLVVISISLKLL